MQFSAWAKLLVLLTIVCPCNIFKKNVFRLKYCTFSCYYINIYLAAIICKLNVVQHFCIGNTYLFKKTKTKHKNYHGPWLYNSLIICISLNYIIMLITLTDMLSVQLVLLIKLIKIFRLIQVIADRNFGKYEVHGGDNCLVHTR